MDEWLEEESIRKYEDRLKEGQVIINNLCAYIRSPFTLASHYDELSEDIPISYGVYKDNQQKFYTDKAEFKAEADVRRGIIKEIHDRLQGPDANTPGTWSDFEYDFSGSTFFYSIDLRNSYYTKSVTFHGSTYQDWTDFRGSTYQEEAHFYGSTYQKGANFRNSTYQDWADFRNSTYQDWADFSGSTYQWAHFRSSIYQGRADFGDST
ncbi:pentapeptide repeat-containing protein, partial [Rothia dentocariosa]|uniref:pentapeptide repeat-containing protein n=2 Tax=Rothia dentocariosa TaxID=2047 RepID=UPI001EFA07AD